MLPDLATPISLTDINDAYDYIDNLLASNQLADGLALLPLLNHADEGVRQRVIDTLDENCCKYALLAARAAATDGDSFVRSTAIEAIEYHGGQQDLYCVSGALYDSDWVVRASAASALGTITQRSGCMKYVKALLPLIESDASGPVRTYAVRAYVTSGGPKPKALIKRRKKLETDPGVLCGLYEASYLLGDKSALDYLLNVALHGSYEPAHVAIGCLGSTMSEDRDKVIDGLRNVIKVRRRRSIVGNASALLRELSAPPVQNHDI